MIRVAYSTVESVHGIWKSLDNAVIGLTWDERIDFPWGSARVELIDKSFSGLSVGSYLRIVSKNPFGFRLLSLNYITDIGIHTSVNAEGVMVRRTMLTAKSWFYPFSQMEVKYTASKIKEKLRGVTVYEGTNESHEYKSTLTHLIHLAASEEMPTLLDAALRVYSSPGGEGSIWIEGLHSALFWYNRSKNIPYLNTKPVVLSTNEPEEVEVPSTDAIFTSEGSGKLEIVKDGSVETPAPPDGFERADVAQAPPEVVRGFGVFSPTFITDFAASDTESRRVWENTIFGEKQPGIQDAVRGTIPKLAPKMEISPNAPLWEALTRLFKPFDFIEMFPHLIPIKDNSGNWARVPGVVYRFRPIDPADSEALGQKKHTRVTYRRNKSIQTVVTAVAESHTAKMYNTLDPPAKITQGTYSELPTDSVISFSVNFSDVDRINTCWVRDTFQSDQANMWNLWGVTNHPVIDVPGVNSAGMRSWEAGNVFTPEKDADQTLNILWASALSERAYLTKGAGERRGSGQIRYMTTYSDYEWEKLIGVWCSFIDPPFHSADDLFICYVTHVSHELQISTSGIVSIRTTVHFIRGYYLSSYPELRRPVTFSPGVITKIAARKRAAKKSTKRRGKARR